MATQWKCPDPDCPPTDHEPLYLGAVFGEGEQEKCSCNAEGACMKSYPVGSIKPVRAR